MKLRVPALFVLSLGIAAVSPLPAQDEMPPAGSEPPKVIKFDAPPAKPEEPEAQDVSYPRPEKTEILNSTDGKRLVGKHFFSLQWIDTEDLGIAEIKKEEDGVWSIKAEQKGKKKDNATDFAKIEGWVAKVEENKFTVWGILETQVSHINEGKPCARQGQWTFEAKGSRKYYRLQEMENPCEGNNLVDYLDVYFKGPKEE
jgi:hypothetical protein